MKRRLLIFLLLALLVSAGVTAWHFRARLFHGDSSEVFQHYRNTPGIMADYIKNFHLDDSTAISVTILQATDSTGWARLVTDFLSSLPTDIDNQPSDQEISIKSFLRPKGRYIQPMDTTDILNNDYIIATQHNRTICVCHIESEEQINAILLFKIKETLQKRKKS